MTSNEVKAKTFSFSKAIVSILQSCQKTKKEHGEPCSKAEKKRVIDLSILAALAVVLQFNPCANKDKPKSLRPGQ